MENTESTTRKFNIHSTTEVTAPCEEHRRIWVGNLDSRVTEIVLIYSFFSFDDYRFQLLKLMQKCGAIEKFDMLFHKGGPMVGQSRGYAFVTFTQNEGAAKALIKLDGSNVGNRSIAVRLAKNIKYDDLQRIKPRIVIPALGRGKREDKISKAEAIKAIEAKLKKIERQTDNLELNIGRELNIPFIHRYQFNKSRDATQRGGPQGKYINLKSTAVFQRQLLKRR